MTTRTRLIVLAAILVLFTAVAALSFSLAYQPDFALTFFDRLNLSSAVSQFFSDGQLIAGECNTASGSNCGHKSS
jgi:hypothetical protein